MDVTAIEKAIAESATTIDSLGKQSAGIAAIGARVVDALKQGHKVLTAGNGGSAAEALHMSEELIGRYRADRVSLPAVCLAADGPALTCIGNDYGYDHVFSRQVEGLGKPGDILVLFSTSGRSHNLELALEAGRTRGMVVVNLLGRDGGAMAGQGDHEIIVTGHATERIQEAHQVILHLILDAVEEAFAEESEL